MVIMIKMGKDDHGVIRRDYEEDDDVDDQKADFK